MKTALITTTINVPYVLKLYRAYCPDVHFFVTGDERTPDEAYRFCDSLPACTSYTPQAQKELGHSCSSLLGWNTIARRNIALLEAIKWGAEIIISVDDDNIPIVAHDGFKWGYHSYYLFTRAYDGLCVQGKEEWFDPGRMQFPSHGERVCQRGFPQSMDKNFAVDFTVEATVAIAQGAILGDPDTSAVDRLSKRPIIHKVSELLQSGFVTDPRNTVAPLNTQNIAFTRELAPCFLLVPQFKRYDDIWASLIAQRYCALHNYYVHFGKPFVWQQRNAHSATRDLEDELFGMKHTLTFKRELDGVQSPGTDLMWEELQTFSFMPEGIAELGAAWAEDIGRVLK